MPDWIDDRGYLGEVMGAGSIGSAVLLREGRGDAHYRPDRRSECPTEHGGRSGNDGRADGRAEQRAGNQTGRHERHTGDEPGGRADRAGGYRGGHEHSRGDARTDCRTDARVHGGDGASAGIYGELLAERLDRPRIHGRRRVRRVHRPDQGPSVGGERIRCADSSIGAVRVDRRLAE